jgi:hypothetical protein
MNLLGLTPCCRICWKSYITVSSCPYFQCFVSFRLHANTLNWTILGAFVAISTASHGEFHRSAAQSASHVFLCLKSRYLSFVNNQKSSWSAMYFPHPGYKWYHKKRESCTDLLHEHIALTYFLQPTTITPQVQKAWKEILHSLEQGKITTTNININTNNRYGSIDMWTLTCLMFHYLLWSMIPTLRRIPKELMA